MTALAKERPTKEVIGAISQHPVAAAVKCFAGGIAVLDASGNCKPAVTATGLICIGRFERTIDNAAGGAGAANADVKAGVFRYANSADTDEITRAEIGDDCYLVDDQTVAKTSGTATRSKAGRIIAVDASGVSVVMGLALTAN